MCGCPARTARLPRRCRRCCPPRWSTWACTQQVPDPAHLAAIGRDIHDIVALALDNSLVAERFTNTAILTTQQAHDLGTLGYIARASGLDIDARRDHPATIQSDDGHHLADLLNNPTHTTGDVLARFHQRAAEIDASLAILDTLVRTIKPGIVSGRAATSHKPLPARGASGVGIIEGWRGTIVHRVEISPGHRLARVKIVDPSFFNWPALPVALAGTIVPDFPSPTKASTSPTPATTCDCRPTRRQEQAAAAIMHTILTLKSYSGHHTDPYSEGVAMPRPSARVSAAARSIGEQFVAWRKLQGLTAVQVSERAGISRNTLRRVETGDTGVGLQAFLSVARALGILDAMVAATDPYETDLGRARADETLPKRIRQ